MRDADMTWEQKLDAMQALCGTFNVSLCMRRPGNWYVSVRNREVGGDGVLSGEFGNGATPEEAVLDDWRRVVTELPHNKYIVVNANTPAVRVHVRWNGYMWARVSHEAP